MNPDTPDIGRERPSPKRLRSQLDGTPVGLSQFDEQPAPDPSAWIWGATGYWDAGFESVQPAEARSRSEAREIYARDIGEPYVEVSAWKRYARALTLQEQWEWLADEEGWTEPDPDGEDGAERDLADTPPDGWTPPVWNEDLPCWEFCLPDTPGACAVWVCGHSNDRPPHRPVRRAPVPA